MHACVEISLTLSISSFQQAAACGSGTGKKQPSLEEGEKKKNFSAADLASNATQ
jgi:hypothetical protein